MEHIRHISMHNLGYKTAHRSPLVAQNYETVLVSISPMDVGFLWYHQMFGRIMGNYQLKLPYIRYDINHVVILSNFLITIHHCDIMP